MEFVNWWTCRGTEEEEEKEEEEEEEEDEDDDGGGGGGIEDDGLSHSMKVGGWKQRFISPTW